MYRLLGILFLIVSCNRTAPKQPPNATTTDSLIQYLKERVNPYFHQRNPGAAGNILDSLKEQVAAVSEYRLTGAWLRAKAVEKTMEEKLDSGRYYGDRALQLALENDTTLREILAAKTQLADILKEQNENDSALRYAHDAYYIAKKIDTAALPLICLRLSEIYSKIQDLGMRRQYLFEGLRYSTSPVHKTVFTNNISSYYGEMDRYDSALLFFKAMEKDTSFSGPYFDAVKFENLGISLIHLNRYQEGLRYQLKAMAIHHETRQTDALSYFNLADSYRHLKDYHTSLQYLDTAITLAIPQKDWNLIKRIWHARSTTLSLLGNYQAAYSALDSAYNYFGTEVDSSIIIQARELETQYQVKSKDDEIKSLALENAAKNKINEQQRFILFMVAVLVVLLGLLSLLIWRRRQLKTQIKDFELRQQLLRTRMEPHFIFNSLNVLQSLIRMGEHEKSTSYVSGFAKLLRLSFESAGHNYVTLRDELAALDSYLRLQQLSQENRFDYQIEAYPGYERDPILFPPMLLQPFVENSILHGFRFLKEKGLITVQIQRENQTLRVTIDDNGSGLQAQAEGSYRRAPSTSVTQERLAILSRQFRKPATLNIMDKQTANLGQGLRVELILPFRMME